MALTLDERPKKADAKPETIGTDEVERIIAERVAAEVERIAEARAASVADEVKRQLAAALTTAGATQGADNALLTSLAEAIYSVGNNDQEVGKRRVPPEEMARRVRARTEMLALIEATITKGVQPVYTLTQQMFLGEQIIQPFWVEGVGKPARATEIGWWGEPNEFMHPKNDEAEAIHALFLQSIDSNKRRGVGLRVTPGGLTVRSGGLAPEGGRDVAPRVGRDMPSLAGRNGERPEVHTRVLGTLLPPARQIV